MENLPNNYIKNLAKRYPLTLKDRRVAAVFLCILMTSIILLITTYSYRPSTPQEIASTPVTVRKNVSDFIEGELIGKNILVWDVRNNVALYGKNEYEVKPLASITKVLTAVTALESIPDSTIITMQQEFLKEEGDAGLIEGESWNLRDLLKFSLVMSSNDAAAAIGATAGVLYSGAPTYELGRLNFVEQMNIQAQKIGMSSATFSNETGLDVTEELSGGYASAYDVAKLFSYALTNYDDVLYSTRRDTITVSSLSNILHRVDNTNLAVNSIPNIIASKTGFTDLAGGNLAVVIDPNIGTPIVIVVLDSSVQGRFRDVENLAQATISYLNQE